MTMRWPARFLIFAFLGAIPLASADRKARPSVAADRSPGPVSKRPAPGAASNGLGLKLGLHFTPGFFYNGSFDPGYNGSALQVTLLGKVNILALEGGLELGANASGWDLFFPMGVGVHFTRQDKPSFGVLVTFLPGLKLNRPQPLFLLGVEATARAAFLLTPRLTLLLALGPRYTSCPGYMQLVGPYTFIDLTCESSLVWKLESRRAIPARRVAD